MNHFKVKNWGRFDLAILKVKQIHYNLLKHSTKSNFYDS